MTDPHPMNNTDIVGVWQLVESRARDAAGAPLPASYGPTFMGLVQFHPEGRMMCVLCDGRQHLPDPGSPREYTSYGGSYTFDGRTLKTRCDLASDPRRIGGDEIRQVRFEGDRLVLAPPPRPLANGVMQRRELVWKRIA